MSIIKKVPTKINLPPPLVWLVTVVNVRRYIRPRSGRYKRSAPITSEASSIIPGVRIRESRKRSRVGGAFASGWGMGSGVASSRAREESGR